MLHLPPFVLHRLCFPLLFSTQRSPLRTAALSHVRRLFATYTAPLISREAAAPAESINLCPLVNPFFGVSSVLVQVFSFSDGQPECLVLPVFHSCRLLALLLLFFFPQHAVLPRWASVGVPHLFIVIRVSYQRFPQAPLPPFFFP